MYFYWNFLLVLLASDRILTEQIEREYVEIRDVSEGWSSRTLNLQLTAFGQSYDLRLEPVPFQNTLKFLTMEEDTRGQHLIKYHGDMDFQSRLYSNGDTIFYLHSKGDKVQVEGILSDSVSIQKSEKNKSHVAVRRKRSEEVEFKDPIFFSQSMTNNDIKDVPPVPSLVQPEVMVIVDYKNFKAMNFDQSKVGVYLTIFWQAVNSRYALVKDPEIQLIITSVLVMKNDYLQPYIRISRVTDKNGVELLDMDKALTAMGIYYFKFQNSTLPYFDLAMLMTGEDMAGKSADGWNNKVAGVAPVAGSCGIDYFLETYSNFGMAEDLMPYYTGVLNQAHEVAHLLGSVHDGDPPMSFLEGQPGALDCPWSDGYLMSYKFGTKNHLRWSDCTIDQFRWMITKYKRGWCLRDKPLESLLPTTSIHPGQLISLDEQCKSIFGKSYIHLDSGDKEERCVKLWCSEDQDHLHSQGPALDGSPCGYTGHKWCINGECVFKD